MFYLNDYSFDRALSPDALLENIRADIPSAPDVTKYIDDWLAKSAGYTLKRLTSRNQLGWDILHAVVRFVDGTPVGSKGDWKHLAGCLGLDICDIVVRHFGRFFGTNLKHVVEHTCDF